MGHLLNPSVVRHSVLYLSLPRNDGRLCPRDLGQDVRSRGSPGEGLGISVVLGDVQIDGELQLGHAGEAVAPNPLV